MIKVKGYGNKVTINSFGNTTIRSELKEVVITKLKNTGSKNQCGYYGFCPNYSEQFPTDIRDEFDHLYGWVHIIKNMNKGIKLPVLKQSEEAEV